MACSYYYEGNTYTKEELIKFIEEKSISPNQENHINYTIFNQAPLRKLMNIGENSTLEEHIKLHFPEQFARLIEFNPDVKFNFTDKTIAGFDDNNINIALSEVFHTAKYHGLDYIDVLNYLIQHEMSHAITLPGYLMPENREYIDKALLKAKEFYRKNPFIDKYRGNILFNGYPYALRNSAEFLSELHSNKDFIKWMTRIGNGNENFWERIINVFRNLLGFGPMNSLYKEINELINSEQYKKDSREIIEFYPEELSLYENVNFNSIWLNTADSLEKEYFKNPDLNEIFQNLPSMISKIKETLKKVDPKSKDASTLNALIQDIYKVQTNEDRIKVIINTMQTAYLISQDLRASMGEIIKSTATISEKNTLLYSLYKQAKDLQALEPIITEISKILSDRDVSNVNTNKFISQISHIVNIKDQILAQYTKMSKAATIEKFSLKETQSGIAESIQAIITQYEKDWAKTSDEKLKAILVKRIEAAKKRLNLIPTENIIKAIVNGEIADASLMDLKLNSLALNANPLIQMASKLLTDADNRLAARRGIAQNTIQTILTKLRKDLGISTSRNQEEVTKEITVEVERVTGIKENPDGTLEPIKIKQLAYIADYLPEYITEFEELQAYINYHTEKRNEYSKKTDSDPVIQQTLNDNITQAYKNLYNFKKEHTEGYYTEEYYKHKELENEELTGKDSNGNTVTTSLGEKYRFIFSQIENLEREQRNTEDSRELIEIAEDLRNLWADYSEIASPFTNLGTEKEGIDKLLYEQAVKFREEKKKIGERISTESDEKAFQDVLSSLLHTRDFKIRTEEARLAIDKKRFDDGKISILEFEKIDKNIQKRIEGIKEDYNNSYNSLYTIPLTKEYTEERERLKELVRVTREKVLAVPEIAELFGGTEEAKRQTKENYDKLSKLTSAYKDNDGVINGIAYTKNKPETIALIKEIEEAEIELGKTIRKYTKLSLAETKELNDLLYLKDTRTEEENIRLKELQSLQIEIDRLSEKHKEIFKEYSDAVASLRSLTESSPTSYYEEEVSRQKTDIKHRLELDARNNFEDFIITHKLIKNSDGSFSVTEEDSVGNTATVRKYSDDIEAIIGITQGLIENEYQNSEWFQQNHVLKEFFKKGFKGIQEEWQPIYIWKHPTAKDDKYKGAPEPIYIYKTFKVNDNLINPRYNFIAPGLTQPKKSSKYSNSTKLNELKKKPIYYELHQKLKEFYYDTQVNSEMSNEERLFDILPSVPKHNQENKINSMNNLLAGNISETMNRFWASGLGKVDEDSQLIEGGSITKRFKEEKIIPYRFNNKMDISKQSYDLFTSLLIYDNINSDVYNKKGMEEAFQTALAATDNLERRVDSLISGGSKLGNFWSRLRNKPNTIKMTEIKDGKSVLNQTIKHMLDTHIYSEYKTDAVFNVLGTQVDAHKAVAKLKTLSSRMIFGGKIYGPVKNYLSSSLNGYMNTGLGEGFASKKDYAKALAIAPTMMRHIMMDYRKVGNKSSFGQAMDYFKVLHGGVYTAYGDVVQWTALGEAKFSNLALIKNSTELIGQMTTFLSISYANKIEVNGVLVPFHEAFETVKGEFKPISGAIFNGKPLTQENINHFIGKIAHINRRLNGAFRELDKSEIEKTAVGSMLFFLNGFVMPGIKARYGKETYLAEGDFSTKGYYIEGVDFIRDIFKDPKQFKNIYNTLDKEQQTRVKMFLWEVMVSALFSFAVAIMSMGGGDTKKRLKHNSAAYNYLFALTMGVGSEFQTFLPSPGLGGDELLRKLSSPFAAVRQLVTIGRTFKHLGEFIMGGGRYEQNGVDDGLHDKGDAKFIADLVSFTGWNMKEFDATEKVLQVKASQQLR